MTMRRMKKMTVSTTPRVFCQAEISLRKNPMYLLVIMFCSWTWMGWVDGMGGWTLAQ